LRSTPPTLQHYRATTSTLQTTPFFQLASHHLTFNRQNSSQTFRKPLFNQLGNQFLQMINIFKYEGLELTTSFHRECEKNIEATISLSVPTTHLLQHQRNTGENTNMNPPRLPSPTVDSSTTSSGRSPRSSVTTTHKGRNSFPLSAN